MHRVVYHRLIHRDLRSALRYYEVESGAGLADRFFSEVEEAISSIETNPTGHHFSSSGLRRVSLRSFPYHFLYDVDNSTIWVAVLRHDRRHPNYGLRREK